MKAFIVDSFTKEAFKGNPAGVCFPVKPLNNEQMLQIAREFGLSETAFVQQTYRPGCYHIRYFSPKKEIPLCGHATLASAKVIFTETGGEQIHFITGENIDLFIKREQDNIIMEFPAYEVVAAKSDLTGIYKALGLTEVANTAFSEKSKIILLEIKSADVLKGLAPDFNALLKSFSGINGVLVTAPSLDTEHDYHYRYFWPWAGTNEDPVTGGVQTFLAPYWGKKLGKQQMQAFQSSERTGYMDVELKGGKVFLKSRAVIVLKGDLAPYN